jgi:Domain of unknown function (DUF4166)
MNSKVETQFLTDKPYIRKREKSVSQDSDLDFQRLVGKEGWNRLVPAIRARFSKSYSKDKAVVYKGAMLSVRSNSMGWILAQACRVMGTPLTPYSGRNVTTIVRVYQNENNTGTVWEREYQFPDRKPLIIRSTKMLDSDETLLESVDGGIRMRLRVFEEEGRLVFLSTSYFIKVFGTRVQIPSLLTPGVTRVEHIDEGNGFFRFILSMKHPYLGEMFYQEGIFR